MKEKIKAMEDLNTKTNSLEEKERNIELEYVEAVKGKVVESENIKSKFIKGRLVETYIHNEIVKSYANQNIEANMFFYRDNNQKEIDLIILNDGKLNLVECKSGKNFTRNHIKGFDKLDDTKYEIAGKCIICTTDDAYRINSNVYAFPVRSL